MFCHSQTLQLSGDYLHLIYPPELEINDTTESSNSTSYVDLLLKTDNKGNLSTQIYDKRDDFNFPITNFPFICDSLYAIVELVVITKTFCTDVSY